MNRSVLVFSARGALALSAWAFAATAAAQETVSVGTVTRLTPHSGDVVIFNISGSRANSPACSSQGSEWALSLTTPTGRAMYAMLLAANTQNRAVRVVGWGTCLSWTQRAEPGWMQIEN